MLRQTDQKLNLLKRFAECFLDGRQQDKVDHSIAEMVSQRIYGLALGYEDLNDHDQLRKDPLFGVLAGREDLERPLAGKSTALKRAAEPARTGDCGTEPIQENHVADRRSRPAAGQRIHREP